MVPGCFGCTAVGVRAMPVREGVAEGAVEGVVEGAVEGADESAVGGAVGGTVGILDGAPVVGIAVGNIVGIGVLFLVKKIPIRPPPKAAKLITRHPKETVSPILMHRLHCGDCSCSDFSS